MKERTKERKTGRRKERMTAKKKGRCYGDKIFSQSLSSLEISGGGSRIFEKGAQS